MVDAAPRASVSAAPPTFMNTTQPVVPSVPGENPPAYHDYTDEKPREPDEAPPVEEEKKEHPLVAALNQHFPDDPGHPKTSLYARARRMFQALVDDVTGKTS